MKKSRGKELPVDTVVVEEEDTCQLPSGREVSEVDSGAVRGGRKDEVRAEGGIERGEKREVRWRFLVPVITMHLGSRRSPPFPVDTWHSESARARQKQIRSQAACRRLKNVESLD